ncbi:FxsA family protein [Halomonas elongata]|uniref:FxsA family protein n=1 Tax=Halomonas elongata (strain ATCC 33173 / DSM 2581 / NBRC 15536 / NCIMB 2198 / 1H9) TaxID=768066 RepID=E1V3S8_HALED|nr:FxsA family protein [Halomonas elongata]MBW5801774.1 FxsA family protein [Halomonas elongata]MDL4862291.1 FxsA family protein [Halomonas elongata]RAW08246.1 FxsA family protein [Halomonas elongata]WBF16487.1 FxsA family protein [Halomonas elongata]WPU48928.1 FxsA family protein [Halomonas elongata DSM 2581]
MPFLVIFTVFALLDFILLFSIGSQIGLLTTLALVLGTGFIGLHLIRREGVATFARAQERMARGEVPSGELLTGAALIFGGALLMAPGFLSDALGFMCLIPDARRLMGKLLGWLGLRMGGVHVQGASYRSHASTSANADADWQQADSRQRETRDTSRQDNDASPLEGDFIGRDEHRRY